MKKLLFILTILQVSMLSAQTKMVEKMSPEIKTFKVIKNSSIKLNQADNIYFDYNIIKGNKLVFDYNYKAKDRESVADDEYRERIIFQIDANQKSFVLTGDSLLNAKAYYSRSCFCLDRGNYKINGGTITGKKISATHWKVEMDLIITPTPEFGGEPLVVKVSGTYKMPATTKK